MCQEILEVYPHSASRAIRLNLQCRLEYPLIPLLVNSQDRLSWAHRLIRYGWLLRNRGHDGSRYRCHGWIGILEYPIKMGGFPLKVANRKWKVLLFERPILACAPNPHNASGRCTKKLPFTTAYRIEIDLPQERFGQPCEFGKRLRIHFSRHDSSGFCVSWSRANAV